MGCHTPAAEKLAGNGQIRAGASGGILARDKKRFPKRVQGVSKRDHRRGRRMARELQLRFEESTGRTIGIRGRLGGSGRRGVFLVVDRRRFEVFSLEHLIAVETAEIIDPIPTGHHFGSLMVAELHKSKTEYFSILGIAERLSSPVRARPGPGLLRAGRNPVAGARHDPSDSKRSHRRGEGSS